MATVAGDDTPGQTFPARAPTRYGWAVLPRLLIGVALVAGCGDRDPRATPEGVATAYVRTYFAGDRPGLRRLWATPAQLDEAFVCDSEEPDSAARRAASDLAGLESALYRWETEVRFVEWEARRATVATGERWKGCAARRDLVLEDGDVGFAIRNPDHPDWTPRLEHHGLTLLQVGDRWRIVRWSP